MSNERLPIKFFAPREIDELKVEPGGSSDVPIGCSKEKHWNNVQPNYVRLLSNFLNR